MEKIVQLTYAVIMFGLEKIGVHAEIPPAKVAADLAVPAFNTDASVMAEKIRSLSNPLFGEVKVVGKYINIAFDNQYIVTNVLPKIINEQDAYGANSDGAGKTVLLEYSSPNIAKPMHMGHARNNAIGHALERIYRASGYEVITANYIGDWGMSFAKIMLAYQKWGDSDVLAKDPIRHLLDLYVRVTKEIASDPQLEDEARILFKKLADSDLPLKKLWEQFREISITNFKKVYDLLGITFDIWNGESFYEPYIKNIIQTALDKKAATQEPGGPVVVKLDQYRLPSFLLQKSDGGSLYGARDLAVAKWRIQQYNPDLLLYVVGHEQELYLKQIFKTLGLLGYPEEKFVHVSYGVVTLKSKKISTRSGNIIFLEDGLQEAIRRAKGIPEVGIGAVLFNMLAQSKEKDISFDWDRALNIHGNSAPYIQYGYVRAKAVLAKTKGLGSRVQSLDTYAPTNEHELRLLKMLVYYPEIVRQARQLNSPHLIANFLNDFTQTFNRFYAECPILAAEEASVKNFRLTLAAATAQVIKNGLWLLGINVPEKM